MRTICLLITLIGFWNISSAQRTEKVIVSHADPHDLYANIDADSTTLFYDKMIPSVKPIGVLVILPGSGELIKDVKQQISLHQLALQKGFIVIFPSINWGTNKHEHEHAFLDVIFRQVVDAHKVSRDHFVIGGFSGGGMLALTYAEKANREPGATFLKPRAVFGIDPPLDYAHLWKHCEKDVERAVSKAAVEEGKWIMDMYTQEFGGPPGQFRENYLKYSIFTYDDKDGGNAKYLVNTPVLLYTEPDVQWQMEHRQRDYYDLNCVDIAAMINFLRIKGNSNARLVTTQGKGKRPDGSRHPHSWSIMDPGDCIEWIMRFM